MTFHHLSSSSSTRTPSLLRATLMKLTMVLVPAALALTGCLPSDQTTSPLVTVTAQTFGGITTAQTTSSTRIKLTWNASTQTDTMYYNVYDVSTSAFQPTLIQQVPVPATGVTLQSLTPGKLYRFRVRIADSKNNEDVNTVDLGAIPYAGVTNISVIDGQDAGLTFPDTSNADSYTVFCHTALNPIDMQMGDSATPWMVTPATASSTTTNGITTVISPYTNATISRLTNGTQYSCRVALVINGVIDNNTNYVTFTPIGTANALVFTTQPGSAAAGTALSPQPVIKIVDQHGNIVSAGPDSTALITLAPSGDVLYGNASVNAVNGIATFVGLQMRKGGTYTLTATKAATTGANSSGILTQDVNGNPFVSNSFTINAGAPSSITSSITAVPASTGATAPLIADGINTYTVTIVLKDQYGTPLAGILPTFTSTDATNDTIVQPTAMTDATGTTTGTITSTFANPNNVVTINAPSGLSNLTYPAGFIAGPAYQIAFGIQPTQSGAGALVPTVSVLIEDRYGNLTSSTANVTMSLVSPIPLPSPTPVLSGTGSSTSGVPVAAVNGTATFTALSINSIGTGYQLSAAAAGVGTSVTSNKFNVTAASPYKISMTMTSSASNAFISGGCSNKIQLQLQDSGGNATNSSISQDIQLTGLGSASVYTSCSGTAQSATRNISVNSSITYLYLKDTSAESMAIVAKDVNNILQSGNLTVLSTPALIGMTPTASTVVSGKCLPISLAAAGSAGAVGPNFNALALTISMTSTSGSPAATFWSDSTCSTTPLTATSIPYAVQTTAPYGQTIYMKDTRAETLSMSISDNAGILTNNGGIQTVQVLASNINFTGPTSVVSGICSGTTKQFNLQLTDASGNPVTATANTPLTIKGLSGSSTALFYASNDCSGTGSATTLTFPSGQSTYPFSFKDATAETLSVYFVDPNSKMANSQTVTFGVSPSKLSFVGSGTTLTTTACSSLLNLELLDSVGNNVGAVTPITSTVAVSGASGSAALYSDSACTIPITSTNTYFAAGVKLQPMYFMAQAPGTFTLTPADSAGVLTASTPLYSFNVTTAPGFIGTSSVGASGVGQNQAYFVKGVAPVAARINGVQQVQAMHMESDGQALFIADSQEQRVHKYTYGSTLGVSYVGWIGMMSYPNNNYPYQTYTVPNLFLSAPASISNSTCAGATYLNPTPGWCQGGQSTYSSYNTSGMLRDPRGMADDGTSLFVVNNAGGQLSNINRFNLATGVMTGWIGQIGSNAAVNNYANWNSATTVPAIQTGTGNPSTCGSSGITPGWCLYGQNAQSGAQSETYAGTGQMWNANALAYDGQPSASWGGYLYVGNAGAILRFNAATGAYAGFVGWIGTGATTPTSCVSGTPAANSVTPSWCYNGTYTRAGQGGSSPDVHTNGGSVNNPSSLVVAGNYLFALYTDDLGTIVQYDLSQNGKYITNVTNIEQTNYHSANSMATDGTNLYVADSDRVVRFGITTANPLTISTTGWIGKVQTTPTANGAGYTGSGTAYSTTVNQSCASLAPNEDTNGWCINGVSKWGIGSMSFGGIVAIEYDGAGNVLTGGSLNNNGGGMRYYDSYVNGNPSIRSFATATGSYNGVLSQASSGLNQWSANTNDIAAYYGSDDYSMNQPEGVYNDGSYMYVVEQQTSRIKKIQLNNGQTIGWIGGRSSTATSGIGTYASSCTPNYTTFSMGKSPTWCLGGMPMPMYMWNQTQEIPYNTDGIMYMPAGITGDGTATTPAVNLWVVDYAYHRVQWFDAATGAYKGWVGKINNGSSSYYPTGGTCQGTTGLTATNGWCLGGYSMSSNTDGGLQNPTGIVYTGNALYVLDSGNNRIVKFAADTGLYIGWMGASTGTAPSICTSTTNAAGNRVSSGAWCTGGTPTSAGSSGSVDAGGGFQFNYGYRDTGITTDGTYLYVSNNGSDRIDKIQLSNATWVAAMNANPLQYTSVWSSTYSVLQTWGTNTYFPRGLWTDGTNIYGSAGTWNANGNNSGFVWRASLSTGTMSGWRGGIQTGGGYTAPSGGDSACVNTSATVTPGWCKGGAPNWSVVLGGFIQPTFVSGDPTAGSGFVYVTDESTGRVTRLPK